MGTDRSKWRRAVNLLRHERTARLFEVVGMVLVLGAAVFEWRQQAETEKSSGLLESFQNTQNVAANALLRAELWLQGAKNRHAVYDACSRSDARGHLELEVRTRWGERFTVLLATSATALDLLRDSGLGDEARVEGLYSELIALRNEAATSYPNISSAKSIELDAKATQVWQAVGPLYNEALQRLRTNSSEQSSRHRIAFLIGGIIFVLAKLLEAVVVETPRTT